MNSLLHSKLLKNGIWLFILQIFNTVVPMVTLPYVTRILGKSGYGDFSLALNWILYFQVIVEYGFGYWGARKVATSDKSSLQKTFSTIITARVTLMILSFAIMYGVYVFSGKDISHFICMCILFSMVIGVSFQLTWLFQGMQDMKYITLINAASRLLSVILIFLLVKNRTDVYLYCFLYSCTFVFSALFGLFFAHRKYGVYVRLCKCQDIIWAIEEAWPLFISQAMAKVLSGFGVTVLGIMASNSAIGVYSAIYKIPYTMALFFNPISQAIYPEISVSFGKSNDLGIKQVKKIAMFIVPLFVGASVLIMLLHYPIVLLLFGEEYVGSSSILIPLGIWFVLSVVNNFLGVQILVASGHQKEYSDAFTISALTSIVLYFVLGKLFELFGIALATFTAELLLTILLLWKLKMLHKRGGKDNDQSED